MMSNRVRTAVAEANANIALIKYWGKQASNGQGGFIQNLPATSSLSLPIAELLTRTCVSFDPSLTEDCVFFNNLQLSLDNPKAQRIIQLINQMRKKANCELSVCVQTLNNFPDTSGLASSASGFAALVLAVDAALSLYLPQEELAAFARNASASAARSLLDGFVGLDVRKNLILPETLFDTSQLPLDVTIVLCGADKKDVPSTLGMQHTALTSPYYSQWLNTSSDDYDSAIEAIRLKNYNNLIEIVEQNCLKMHAAMLTALPPLLYWQADTLTCIHQVHKMRKKNGLEVFFTIDAGHHVKIFSAPSSTMALRSTLQQLYSVDRLIFSSLGRKARVLSAKEASKWMNLFVAALEK